jgi:exopolysaccharide biosynthesis polyprenyl glycosylphosphotransferase
VTVINVLAVGRRTRAASQPGQVGGFTRYIRLLIISDTLAALLAALTAYGLHPEGGDSDNLHVTALRLAVILMPPGWAMALWLRHAYDGRRMGSDPQSSRKILGAAGILGVSLAASALLVDSTRLVRQVLIAIPLAAVLTPLLRRICEAWYLRIRAERVQRRVLLVGHARAVAGLSAAVRPGRGPNPLLVGACLVGPVEPAEIEDFPLDILGDLGSVAEAACGAGCDTVVLLASPELDGDMLRSLIWRLQDEGVDLALAPIQVGVATERILVDTMGGMPLLHIRAPILSGPIRVCKELVERVAAALLLLAIAPVMLGLAVVVRGTSPGPALFRQRRVGLDGREFTLLKFRTMVVDAERLRARLEHLNERRDGPLFKIREDPRVTRVGAVLRRYSLDELPQLINVLTGAMSLIGPRPPLPSEVAAYTGDAGRRLAVKPGLTGLWQVSGRSTLSWADSVRLDLDYVENWSARLDAEILLRTTSAVVRGTGAF